MDLSQLPGLLLPWFDAHKRELPWRNDRLPYHVWLSEIMLQQTRVEAVKGYYTRFLDALPSIPALAAAEPDRLNKLWEGLGYYSRVRNLQLAASVICEKYGGAFPESYESIRALPGIGDYTAGAICSICFDMPTPAVDGNVLRVYARLTGDRSPITRPDVKKKVTEALREIYPQKQCGAFTQALMELGATVCVPNGAPDCAACPLRGCCISAGTALWRELPCKERQKPRKKQQKTVFLLHDDTHWAICKRPARGLLAGLWEFPNAEGTLSGPEALAAAEEWGFHPSELEKELHRNHIFTHVEWEMTGYVIRCSSLSPRFTAASVAELDNVYSLPTAFRQFREKAGP